MSVIDPILRWFDGTKLWHFLSKNIVAHFTFRWWRYNEFDWDRYPELRSILEKPEPNCAYAFVCCDTLSLAGILIRNLAGSTWSHAGMILSADRIVEMKGKGMLIHHLLFPLSQTDNFAVVKFQLTEENYKKYLDRLDHISFFQPDFSYDFQQELDGSEMQLYCSELVYYLLKDLVEVKKPDHILGRFAFSPDSVYLSGKVIFEHFVR